MEEKYNNHYFVSYSFKSGFGMTQIDLKYPIKTFDDVLVFKKIIEKELNTDSVVILNYKLLRE